MTYRKPYLQKFKNEWTDELKWLRKGKTDSTASCVICSAVLNITSGGLKDLRRHAASENHKKNERSVANNALMTNFVVTTNNGDVDACLLWANFVTENNLSVRLSDNFNKLVPIMFPDSDIAKNFHCGRTKTSLIIEQVLGDTAKEEVINKMKSQFFTLMIDESTDKATLRQMVIMARMFGADKVETYLYEVVAFQGAATGENLFNVVNNTFERDGISWKQCISMSSDGARAMVGEFNSVLSRIKVQQDLVWFLHCTCHVAHLAASHACNELPTTCEQFIRDVYTYFKTSGKRQEEFREIQKSLDLETHKILRPCLTRWLAMLQCVTRTLEQWSALRVYFQENIDAKESKLDSVARIQETLQSAYSKLYFLFLEAVLPRFTKFNVMFQHERPHLHKLNKEMCSLLRQLLASFIKFTVLQSSSFPTVELNYALENQVSDESLFVGHKTRNLLESRPSQITKEEKAEFFRNVRDFYEKGARELYRLLPFNDQVLLNIDILDPAQKSSGDWQKIKQLAKRFPMVIPEEEMDQLNTEFVAYSLSDLSPILGLDENSEIDTYWSAIASHSPDYSTLCKLAKAMLILPHSNAQVERVFSNLTMIKTSHRTRLSSPMLNSLMMCKNRRTLAEFKPTNAMRNKAKHLKKRKPQGEEEGEEEEEEESN